MRMSNTTPNFTTVCFTGPRPKGLYGYHDKLAYQALKEELQKHLVDLIENNHTTTFITGGAQGFDQLACWAVHHIQTHGYPQIKNIVYIPFQNQASRWVETGLFGQYEYSQMLQYAADEVIDISQRYPKVSGAINLLMKRNEAMINDADLVIGLYDFEVNDYHTMRGGTASALRYAQSYKPIMILHPQTYTVQINAV